MVPNQEKGDTPSFAVAPKRRFRRVRFSEAASAVVCTMEPRSRMSDDEKNMVWFSPAEMDGFKNHVRVLSSFLAVDTSGTVHDDEVQVLRVLHQCRSNQRQMRKHLAIRTVLQCQHLLREMEVVSPLSSLTDQSKAHSRARRIGEVSSQCSGWARDMSRMRGLADYFEAYPHAAEAVFAEEKRSAKRNNEDGSCATEQTDFVRCLEEKQRSLKRRRMEDHSASPQQNHQGQ